MKAVVTGGAGFLGAKIVGRLLERGDDVVVFSRSPAGLPAEALAKAGDLRDASDVSRAVEGADVVFHVAAKAGVWGPRDEYFGVNLTGTRNVLAACQKHGVKSLVYTSTPSVVFDRGGITGGDETLPYPTKFLTHYAASKALAEQEVLAANGTNGLRSVALRPHLIWGKGDPHLLPRVLDRARAGKLKQVGNGRNKVDITHVDDAADAHLLALDNIEVAAGKPYFISSETVELWPWINKVLERAGVPRLSATVSAGTAYKAGAVIEFLWKVMGKKSEPPMTRFVAENLATSHWFKLDAAKRDLGYEAQWTGDCALDEYFGAVADHQTEQQEVAMTHEGVSHG
ncbi:MAG: NAD-dependent epimerase/dehydratase family protein [Planctomycetes bacterium]|nr:NAD-dependent epimerase/dehydratase family protein [Planctomycetota bacterium]